ncbi:MAG: UTP--glucose-1-phosphate uridylyltransferase [Lachnospiraceae bacterium]|nr:UTP--glucose-1-phosphate uridylyltransferase [Lachnospiraceae bacterium]
MNYEEARRKLAAADQLHVLKYYEELSADQRRELLEQIEITDFSALEHCKKSGDNGRGKFEPLGALELSEIKEKKQYYTEIGVKAIREGKVGAVLLAGGMGTRLGSDGPKGVYDIGLTRPVYIFERLIENMMDVVRQTGAYFHLFIMTSDKNDQVTRAFLKEKSYFGYPEEYVHFFLQKMAPASDYDGHVYLEEKYRISTSPNGNGGWFTSMQEAGLIDFAHERGIEWMNIFAVDNVLQRIADPVFVGATLDAGVSVGAKVVRKNAPREGVGVMCLEDGRPSIVEYYELTDEMVEAKDAKGDPAYNFGVILNYLFNIHSLETLFKGKMPCHVVEKKIPHIGENGQRINPESPNGYKYEELVLDMIHQLDTCLPFEVEREREFAPIKNQTGVDSVESARTLCLKNGIEL